MNPLATPPRVMVSRRPRDMRAGISTLAALAADNAALAAQNLEMAEAERAWAGRIAGPEAEVARWRELYMAERDARFGRKSESLPKGQLLLDVFNELEASLAPGAPQARGRPQAGRPVGQGAARA